MKDYDTFLMGSTLGTVHNSCNVKFLASRTELLLTTHENVKFFRSLPLNYVIYWQLLQLCYWNWNFLFSIIYGQQLRQNVLQSKDINKYLLQTINIYFKMPFTSFPLKFNPQMYTNITKIPKNVTQNVSTSSTSLSNTIFQCYHKQ